MKKTIITLRTLFLGMACLMISISAYSQDVVDQVNETFNNITSIEVEGSFCSVEVHGHSTSTVEFTGEIKSGKNHDIKIKHKTDGSTLKVWIERPKSIWGNVKGLLVFNVPTNTNVKVDNSSGSVLCEDIGQSEVALHASSGSITAKNIDTDLKISVSSGSLNVKDISGDLHAKTSSGSQSIAGVNGNLYAEASSGSLRIEGIGGDAKLSTSSGSQSINMVDGNVMAKASSGSIRASQVTGDLKASTSSGGIKLDQVTGALALSTTSGSQKGVDIKLTGSSSFKSSSGSVNMALLNETEELSFELLASSGSLYAKGVTGKKKLIVDKGPVKVYGNSSSGSQSYK
jgi:hypothetical protein